MEKNGYISRCLYNFVKWTRSERPLYHRSIFPDSYLHQGIAVNFESRDLCSGQGSCFYIIYKIFNIKTFARAKCEISIIAKKMFYISLYIIFSLHHFIVDMTPFYQHLSLNKRHTRQKDYNMIINHNYKSIYL